MRNTPKAITDDELTDLLIEVAEETGASMDHLYKLHQRMIGRGAVIVENRSARRILNNMQDYDGSLQRTVGFIETAAESCRSLFREYPEAPRLQRGIVNTLEAAAEEIARVSALIETAHQRLADEEGAREACIAAEAA